MVAKVHDDWKNFLTGGYSKYFIYILLDLEFSFTELLDQFHCLKKESHTQYVNMLKKRLIIIKSSVHFSFNLQSKILFLL